jgi:hypothetical protein
MKVLDKSSYFENIKREAGCLLVAFGYDFEILGKTYFWQRKKCDESKRMEKCTRMHKSNHSIKHYHRGIHNPDSSGDFLTTQLSPHPQQQPQEHPSKLQ